MKLVLITKRSEYPVWPVLVLSVSLQAVLAAYLAEVNGLLWTPHGRLAERLSRVEITDGNGQVATDAVREVLPLGLPYGRPKKYPELAAGLIARAGFRCRPNARVMVPGSYLLICENRHAGFTPAGCERR